MIYSTSTDNYTYTTGGFDIVLNALGTDAVGRNYTQCYAIDGAKLYVYINDDKFDVHILRRVMTGEEIEGMPDTLLSNVYARAYDIKCFPTHFTSDSQRYVYAAIPRSENEPQIATIVYPSQQIDLFGCIAEVGSDPDNPRLIQVGDPSYYYINLFGIISSASLGAREWISNIKQGAINGYIIGDDAAITRGNSQLTKEDLEREIRELRDYIDSNLFFERYPLGDPYQETTTDPESGEQVPLYEQSKDKEGELLYWTTAEQVDKSTEVTEWPVMEPVMNENTAIRLKPKFLGLFADGFISALGVNPDSTPGGGGGVDLLTNWSAFAGLDDDTLSHFAVGANLIYELKQKVDSLPSGGGGSGSSDISAYTFWGQRPDGTTVSGSLSNVGNITFAPVPDASASASDGGALAPSPSPYSIGLPTLGIHRLYFGTTGIYLEVTDKGHLHTNAALYSDSFISALGLNDDSSAVIGGADLLSDWSRIKQHIDSGDASSFAVSADLIYGLYTRKQGLDESDVTSIINKYKFATQADLANYVTLHTPQTIDGAKTFDEDLTLTPTHSIIIGDAVIGYDSTHHALSISHKTSGERMGLYATGFVSALGVNDASSDGVIDKAWLDENDYITKDQILALINGSTPDGVLTQNNWKQVIKSSDLQSILNGVYALKDHTHSAYVTIAGNDELITGTKLFDKIVRFKGNVWLQSDSPVSETDMTKKSNLQISGGMICSELDTPLNHGIKLGYNGINETHFYEYEGKFFWHKHPGSDPDITLMSLTPDYLTLRAATKLRLGSVILEDDTKGNLKVTGGIWSTSFVSALGLNDASASSGIDKAWLDDNGYITRTEVQQLIAAAGIGSGSEIDTSEFITSEQVSSTTTDYLADYMKASNLSITTWSGDATSMTAKLRYNSQDYEIGTIPAATTSKAGLMSAIHLTDLNNIKNDYVTRTTYQTISAEKLFSAGIRLGVNAKILDSDGSENHAISIGGSGNDYMDFYLCMGGNASYRWHDRYVSGNRDDILMTLTTTGLGIGLGNTTYPSFRLHVNGTARIVDDLQLGTSLTFKNGNKTISIEPDYTHNAIKINGNLYATGWISALGANGTNNDPLETTSLKIGTGLSITEISKSGNYVYISFNDNGTTTRYRLVASLVNS